MDDEVVRTSSTELPAVMPDKEIRKGYGAVPLPPRSRAEIDILKIQEESLVKGNQSRNQAEPEKHCGAGSPVHIKRAVARFVQIEVIPDKSGRRFVEPS